MELITGQCLQDGKYVIQHTLGKGGFGITYRAVQKGLDRPVAIKEFFMSEYCTREDSCVKVSNPSYTDTVAAYKAKFIKEARLIASMNNAHIVRIYDVFEENGTAYYVMELLQRGSLKDFVEIHGGLSEDAAVTYITQVAEALYHIHRHNTLHLDIKPANVMLNDYNEAVLIDFGISRHFDSSGEATATANVGITEGYSPIEQYDMSNASGLQPETDIYALGATLYYLLSGVKPPKAGQVIESGLPSLPDAVSSQTRKAVAKAMSPKKADRYHSVLEFVEVLGRNIHIVEAPAPSDDETVVVGATKPAAKKSPEMPWRTLGYGLGGVIVAIALFLVIKNLPSGNKAQPEQEKTEKVSTDSGSKSDAPSKAVNEGQKAETQAKESKTEPAKAVPASSSKGKLDLGYAVYEGEMKNGKPDGYGVMTFTQERVVDQRDPAKTVAHPGDRLEGDFAAGKLIMGNLKNSSGEKVAFINIGA